MDATTPERIRSRFTHGTCHRFSLFLLVYLGILSCRSRGTVQVGGPCTLDISCTTQACIPESRDTKGVRWTGGYCSGNCANTPCPDGHCRTFADNRDYCVSKCSTKDDCRPGYVCATAVEACLPDCRLGWSCGDSLTCDAGTGNCVPSPVQTKGIGSSCSLNVECQGGLCIPQTLNATSTGWTEGYCTQDCANGDCPQGAKCQAFLDGNSRCLSTCTATTDCRTGYVCNLDIKGCLPDCRRGWSCGDSLTCDAGTGNCVPPPVQTKGVGTSCSLNRECQGGICIPQTLNATSTGWTEGYCTQDCANGDCPQGAICQAFLDGNSRCLSSCTATTNCRTGYVCNLDIPGCLPDCRLGWSCGTILDCDATNGMCRAPLSLDAGTTIDASMPLDAAPVPVDVNRDGPGSGTGGLGPGGPGGRT